MEELWNWVRVHFLQRKSASHVIKCRTDRGQIFACIMLYYLFRVRRVSFANLAKGPARIVDGLAKGFRRAFTRHAEPTPAGREAENNKAF